MVVRMALGMGRWLGRGGEGEDGLGDGEADRGMGR